MSTTSIGNSPGGSVTELIQDLKSDLAKEIGVGGHSGLAKGGQAKAAGTTASKDVDNAARPVANAPPGPTPVTDVASVLLSEVATSDLTKLSRILDPAPDVNNSKVLDSLLNLAVQEVAKGNGERAVGYLADYATRDPRRAETLPLQPELEPVRDKIDSMVSRMAIVAKMSAEDGLSRAEQTASEVAGKLSNWDTNADVLIKLAHRLFDAGGYANYSRTAELAKVVSDAGAAAKPHDQALAASAASGAMGSQATTQMVPGVMLPGINLPGINVPYWASPDFPIPRVDGGKGTKTLRRASSDALEDAHGNFVAIKEMAATALRHLWFRAPLLVIMLTYFFIGLSGGIAFALGSRVWPVGVFVTLGNIAFSLWAIGFLAIVGFGFYARIKYTPPRR